MKEKNAEYFIRKIKDMGAVFDLEPWLDIDRELAEWRKNASAREREKFVRSGAGEMLHMVISGLKMKCQG